MTTLLEYTDYIKFKRYIKESLDEHMFDEDPGVDFGEHWVKSENGSPELAEVLKTRDFKYALCGHVHSGQHLPVEFDGKKLVNVSLKNEDYKENYYPFEFEI